eukprot:scaffold1736_cov127-Cylindrotheca_fusiformis.AAC.68
MPAKEPSLDELNYIMNLQRQEAFDDATRQTMSSSTTPSDPPSENDGQHETAEETLLKIVGSPLPGMSKERMELAKAAAAAKHTTNTTKKSRFSYSASGSAPLRYHPSDAEREEWRKTIERSQSQNEVPSPSGSQPNTKSGGLRRSSSTVSVSRISPKGKRRSMGRRERSSSSRSLTMDMAGDGSSVTSNDTRNSERGGRSVSSLDPHNLISAADSMDDEGSRKGEDGTATRYRVKRSSSNPRNDQRRGRRNSSTRQNEGQSRSKGRTSSKDAESRRRRSRSRPKPSTEVDDEEKFEQLWTPNSQRKTYSYGDKKFEEDNPISSGSFASLKQAMTDDSKKKKTKLEKIHELQATCERYKTEWINASREKKKFRKELQSVQSDMVSLNMEIETHKAEAEILRRQLSESILKLDETEQEQRKERTDYSSAAKELAQSRIDFTKSLNEVRELRIQMDKLEAVIREKDAKIGALTDELGDCKQQIKELKLDLIHADDEGIKLDGEIKRMEEELHMFKEAAEKDGQEGGADNLRRAQSDVEKRLQEEKERRLLEREEKLEARMKQFEEERERFFEKQKEREQGLAERQHIEHEKQKESSEHRKEMDAAINSRLKELEESNAALQGRLKSEQLDSTMKLKTRDQSIEVLQKSLAEIKKQLLERDADPEGIVALQREVESAKAETAAMNDDLAEAQRLNGMLEEEIEDLRTGSSELRGELTVLQQKSSTSATEMEKLKKKVDEWHKKSSEWTDKAFLWKEKAEYWEKVAREIDPYYKEGNDSAAKPKNEDPQALFLQAAFEKKKAAAAAPGAWKNWGLFSKGSDDRGETQARIQELEAERANQADIIKTLKSEIVRIQSNHKEETYRKQQQILQVRKEMEAIELHNTNLIKQLELARKLENFAAQEFTTSL